MTAKTKATLAAEELVNELYQTKTISEYSNAAGKILTLIASWDCPVEQKEFSSLHFSNLLQHIASFSVQHVQGVHASNQSKLQNLIVSALHNYANLCFPPVY